MIWEKEILIFCKENFDNPASLFGFPKSLSYIYIMREKLKVNATINTEVLVDPIEIIKKIPIIGDDWVVEEDGKYIRYTEQSAGTHSFDLKVGEVDKEIYDVINAQKILINYLNKNK